MRFAVLDPSHFVPEGQSCTIAAPETWIRGDRAPLKPQGTSGHCNAVPGLPVYVVLTYYLNQGR